MKLTDIRWTVPCALALLIPAAFAQSAADAAAADVPATSLEFNSTFTGYRVYTEQAVGSWRDANDEVGRIGGWRAYAKEAAPADGATPAPGPVQDHSKHGTGQGGKP